MRCYTAIFLLLAMTCLGTGSAEWLHVTLEHSHPAHEKMSAGHQPTLRAAADGGHDEADCPVCAGLHAPFAKPTVVVLEVEMRRAVDRTIELQAQRLDASVPAPRGCRGPPVM